MNVLPKSLSARRLIGDSGAAPMKLKVMTGVAILLLLGGGLCWRHRQTQRQGPVAGGPSEGVAWLRTERKVDATDTLKTLQATFRDTPEASQRRWTLMAAAKLGEPAAVVWLAEVASGSSEVKSAAVDALAKVANPKSGLELGDIATSDGPVMIRLAAIRALVPSGDLPQAVQLTSLVADPKQPLPVRQQSAQTLGLLRRPGAIEGLGAALEESAADTTPAGQQFRITIVLALGRIGTPAGRAVLEQHAKRELPERNLTEHTYRSIPVP